MAVGVAAPLARHRLRLRPPAVTALSGQAPIALVLATPRSRLRDAAVYALQMWAYYAQYDMPDDDPQALLGRVRVDYPIRADRALAFGTCPTHRLQRALGRPGQLRKWEYVLACVHWSWFVVPHGSLLYILRRRRDLYPSSAALMAACFDLGAVVYWALPTAPPWWAAGNGNMPPVRRIMAEAGERFWGRLWRPLYHSLEGNPFAAMPSLHFGTSVMAARVLARVGRGPGALGWSYALTLGFALVYLGEHYVVDLIAGWGLVELIRAAAPHGAPAFRAFAGAVHRLEPGSA